MTDIFSKEKRSWLMSRVLPKGNRSTEGRFTEILRRKKTKGWRRGLLLYGKPDFVFIKARIAVFIDGCFGTVVLYTVMNSRHQSRSLAKEN